MFDRQKAFDTALNGLRNQGRRSLGGIGCRYRGKGGAKCAIGFLIPDDRYSEDIEGKSADHDIIIEAVDASFDDGSFLWGLQRDLHDMLLDDLGGLEGAAREFAREWGLQYTPLVDQ